MPTVLEVVTTLGVVVKGDTSGKVYNPESGRLVKASGDVARKVVKGARELLARAANESIHLTFTELMMLKTVVDEFPDIGETRILPPVSGVKPSKKAETPIELPPKVLMRLKKQVSNAKKRVKGKLGKLYLNDGHEKACRTGEWSHLDRPFIDSVKTLYYPIDVLNYTGPSTLNASVPPFVRAKMDNSVVNALAINANNFHDQMSDDFVLKQNDNLDMEWIKAQNAYIRGLSKEDLYTLRGNCEHSHSWVNAYLRGQWSMKTYMKEIEFFNQHDNKHTLPVYFQMKRIIMNEWDNKFLASDRPCRINGRIGKPSAWIREMQDHNLRESERYVILLKIADQFARHFVEYALDLFTIDLHRIIAKAPPCIKTITVYRGTSDDIFKGHPNRFYTNNGFISTSFDAQWSKKYTRGNTCCFQRIRLLKGTPVVLVAGINPWGEKEIVINHGSTYFIRNRNVTRMNVMDTKTLCPTYLEKLQVTDVDVLKRPSE